MGVSQGLCRDALSLWRRANSANGGWVHPADFGRVRSLAPLRMLDIEASLCGLWPPWLAVAVARCKFLSSNCELWSRRIALPLRTLSAPQIAQCVAWRKFLTLNLNSLRTLVASVASCERSCSQISQRAAHRHPLKRPCTQTLSRHCAQLWPVSLEKGP